VEGLDIIEHGQSKRTTLRQHANGAGWWQDWGGKRRIERDRRIRIEQAHAIGADQAHA